MKIKQGFVLRKVGTQWAAVAVGAELVDFNAMVSTNETGAFLWELLKNGSTRQELIDKMTAEYEVDEETAAADIDEFTGKLAEAGILEA